MTRRKRGRRGAGPDHGPLDDGDEDGERDPELDDDDDDGAELDEALDRALESLPEARRGHRPSRREKRRGAEHAFDLGKALVELSPQKLEKLPLPEDIADAVQAARRIRSHGARKRQMQYLGKLLRQSDDADAIQSAYERLSDLDRRGTVEFQRVERWRARLLDEGESALDALVVDYPEADREKLWRLVEESRQQSARGKPPAAFRALFRELRDLVAREERSATDQARDASEE